MTITSNISTITVTTYTGYPVIFLNQSEIDAIKANIAASREPWKSAFNGASSKSMISLANSALSVPLQTVVNKGTTPPSGDQHDYYAQPAYQFPGGDITDQISAETLKFAIRKVALGYMFTGEARYANKVKDFIYQWCLNPATKVNPRYPPYSPEWANDSKVFLPRCHQSIVLGAAAIWNYPDFQQYKASFKSWLIQMIDATTWDTNGYNNWGTQRDLFLIMAGALLYYDTDTRTKGLSMINTVINRFKIQCFNSFVSEGRTYAAKIDTDGSFTHERNRTTGNPLIYSTFELFGYTAIAEVAYHYNTNLYTYTENSRSLEKALLFHVPYILDPSTWPYTIRGTYTNSNVGIYEVAYTRYNRNPLYKDIITRFGRPMEEYNVMGATTLTHGSSFVN